MPLILGFLAGLLSFFPLLAAPKNPFFDVDPEVMYVSNAVAYIHHKQIVYTDHPGTPYILTIAASFVPFRIWAKYIVHQPFVDWYLLNIDLIFFYSRVLSLTIFVSAIALLLYGIRKFTRSPLAVLTAWLGLLIYPNMLDYGVRIMPETFSLLVFSIWAYIFLSYLDRPRMWKLPLLVFVGGLALATKYTNLALVAIPLVAWPVAKLAKNERIRPQGFMLLLAIGYFSYFLATKPINGGNWLYPTQIRWIINLATHSGLYGTGSPGLDVQGYISTLRSTFQALWPYLLILPVVIILVWKERVRVWQKLIIAVAVIVPLGIFLIFAKFAKLHYQFGNLLVLILVTVYLLRRYRLLLLIVALVALYSLPGIVNRHWLLVEKIESTERLRQFADTHPAESKALWDWSYSREQALVWGYTWSGKYYGEELKRLYPRLADMYGYENLVFRHGCWDQAYARDLAIPSIKAANPDEPFDIQKIPGTEMNLITSRHCSE